MGAERDAVCAAGRRGCVTGARGACGRGAGGGAGRQARARGWEGKGCAGGPATREAAVGWRLRAIRRTNTYVHHPAAPQSCADLSRPQCRPSPSAQVQHGTRNRGWRGREGCAQVKCTRPESTSTLRSSCMKSSISFVATCPRAGPRAQNVNLRSQHFHALLVTHGFSSQHTLRGAVRVPSTSNRAITFLPVMFAKLERVCKTPVELNNCLLNL